MPKRGTDSNGEERTVELLEDMFIFAVLKAGVSQKSAREIVKVGKERITRIGKLVTASQKGKA